MITTEIQNELLADIYKDGIKIGWIAQVKGGYDIEILYNKAFIPNRLKQQRIRYINTLYENLKGREFRSMQPLRKFTDFKISI